MKSFFIAAALTVMAGQATAQACSEIRFERGAVSGSVTGQVAEGAPLCFSFGSGNGQTARLQLTGSNNVCFGVAGIIDCQDDFSFRTRKQSYQVRVMQLFRGPGTETFRLTLTIR